jgi:hypothetical protein
VNLLSFENYNGNLGAIGGDTLGMQVRLTFPTHLLPCFLFRTVNPTVLFSCAPACKQGCASSVAQQPGHNGVVPPVILSGTMTRNAVPPQGLCDCR